MESLPHPRVAIGALVCAFALSHHLLAQEPTNPSVPAAVFATAHGLQQTEHGLVGFGAAYSARFESDGIRFAPALGAGAPGAHRLDLRTVAIRQGSTQLPIAAEARPAARGETVVYERSRAIEERYEVRADGLEQSFVFRELPGRGDLVVRCELGGGLAGLAATTAAGLAFATPGLGGVTIGGVTGVDARGARCAGSLRLVDGQLELGLPARFVDRAALPLVLDPLIGTRLDLATGAADDADPCVACDAATDTFCIVWTRTVSAAVGEVYARFYHQTTGLGTTLLLGSAATVRRARIASTNAVDRFLVLWEAAAAPIAAAKLTGVTIDPGRVRGVAFDATALPDNCTEVDLSGNPGTTAADLVGVMVFRRTGVGIQSIAYSVPIGTGAPTFGVPTLLSSDPEAGAPRISKAGNGVRMVTWSVPGWVQAQPVDASGVPIGVGAIAPTSLATVAARVDVDGRNGAFVLVHEDLAGAGNRDIRARAFTVGGATTTAAAAAFVANATSDELQPTIALLGPKYLVAWTRVVGLFDSAVVAKSIAPDSCLACGVEQVLSGTLATEAHPALGTRLAGGSTAPGALIALSSHTTTTPYAGDITATMFTPFATTATAPLWSGCGNGPNLSLVGSLSIGNPACAFHLTTTDPTASLGVFAFGFGGASMQCGVCRFVSPVATVFAVLSGGAADHPLPLPCNAGLIGVGIDAQAAVIGARTDACPLLNTGSATSATRYTIGE